MQAAECVQRGQHVLGHLALVEARAPLGGHPAQHLGLARCPEQRADAGRGAAGQEVVAPEPLQVGRVATPVESHPGRHRHPRFGIVDRGRENRVEPEPTHGIGKMAEGVDRPRQGHRMHAGRRHRLMTLAAQPVRRECRRRAARPVQRLNLAALPLGPEHEAIAADPRHLRLADAQQHGPGNGRVHGVAAALEDIDGDLRRQRVRGGTHALRRKDSGATRKLKIAHALTLF